MRKAFKVSLLSFIIIFISTCLLNSQSFIKICSFNIAQLGDPNFQKDYATIAQMLKDFDLITIQEVRDNGGSDEISIILDSLNSISTLPYQSLIIPHAGIGFGGYEGYAFLYRSPVQIDDRYSTNYGLKESNQEIYGRIPGYVYFRAGNFDFMLVSVHLHWSNKETRTNEVSDLKAWMIEFAQKTNSEERDLIIAGDVNRYGDYSQTAIRNRETAFHQLLTAGDVNNHYRLLACEHLDSLAAREASIDLHSSTVADSKDIYDQIWVSNGVFNEFGAAATKFDTTIGIVAYDNYAPYDTMTSAQIKNNISDHRPLWAKFQIDLEDDDGIETNVDGNDVLFSKYYLHQSYPNPFNPDTRIKYEIPRTLQIEITLYNILGQKIKSLFSGTQTPGAYEVIWDGTNESGLHVSSGIYIYRMQAGEFSSVKRTIFIKENLRRI